MHPPATDALLGIDATALEHFAANVRYYLSLEPRQLPSQYFYDELGSALFQTICRLPWYGIARAESTLIAAHADDVFRHVGGVGTLVELGPGSGEKLRLLLEAAPSRRGELDVRLVDVSPSALALATRTLVELPDVRVTTHRATYDAGIRDATRGACGRTLVAFLGSNIGNFDPPGAAALLCNLRGSLADGDALLLGVDLVKPERTLLLAYDDPLGVTAAFNRNLLVRINRELEGDFNLDQFAHRAVWNAPRSRVEMHLVARSEQAISIRRSQVKFRMAAGDAIWTESSYKYAPEAIADLLRPCGFRVAAQPIDSQSGFALTLAIAV